MHGRPDEQLFEMRRKIKYILRKITNVLAGPIDE